MEVTIEHGEVRRASHALPAGSTQVVTDGQDGLPRDTYHLTRVDGHLAEREPVGEQPVREPVDQVVLVGVTPGPVDGVDGAQTRRELCAWRRLAGRGASR